MLFVLSAKGREPHTEARNHGAVLGGNMLSEGHSRFGFSASPDDYPEAERLDLVELIHGRPVADPYRWLEDVGDPRTQQWCARQDELFARWQERWLGSGVRDRLRRRLTALADVGTVSAPVWRGERWFFTRRGPGQDHPVLLTAGPDGAERTLIDPSALDPSGSATLDGWFPSPDGALLPV